MAFDKPKVTIDLDEYNSLHEEIKTLKLETNELMYKQVIAELINCRGDLRNAVTTLEKLKILVYTTELTHGRRCESYNVTVKKID